MTDNPKLLPSLLLASLFAVASCSDNSPGGTTGETSAPTEPVSAQAADAKAVTGYSAARVAASTWVVHGPRELPNVGNKGFMNNPAFVVTPQGVVVVDPGSSVHTGDMLLREIRKVTDAPVIAVFNTHIHGDHWLGNDAFDREFPEAAIYGHAGMIAKIDNGAGQQWIDTLSTMTEGATDPTRIIKPDNTAADGDSLRIGGHDFDIIHNGKAHTVTDIMIHYHQDNVLFTGDNAGFERILRLDDGSVSGNAEALQTAIDLAPDVVVPGHGLSGGIEVLESYRNYLSTIYATVQQGYDEGLSDFEIKPLVHGKLAAYHDWPGYEDELGKHVSFAYLEIEAAEF